MTTTSANIAGTIRPFGGVLKRQRAGSVVDMDEITPTGTKKKKKKKGVYEFVIKGSEVLLENTNRRSNMERMSELIERLEQSDNGLDESIGDASVLKLLDKLFTSSKWNGMMSTMEKLGYNDLKVQDNLAGLFTKVIKSYFSVRGIGAVSVDPIKHFKSAAVAKAGLGDDAEELSTTMSGSVAGMGGPIVWNPILDKLFKTKEFKKLIDRYWYGDDWVEVHEGNLRNIFLQITKAFFGGRKAKVQARFGF